MRNFAFVAGAAVGVALLTACEAIVQSPIPQAPPAGGQEASFNQRDYALGIDDKLRVTVFNEPNLSGEFTVSQTGVISLSLIGPVQAAGVTVANLENSIATKLRGGYLTDPRVSVEVLTYRPFFIQGEVRSPNQYPYSPGLTVSAAVTRAQGYTYRANTKQVFIKRAGSDQWLSYPTEGTVVRPGDEIRIPERYF